MYQGYMLGFFGGGEGGYKGLVLDWWGGGHGGGGVRVSGVLQNSTVYAACCIGDGNQRMASSSLGA